ncbi:MAG: hypothetical protein E7042_02895 [Lentisphaerae bacterium]|nr:hypothetical protein [Lentisphaerota bacterium]
MNTFASKVVFAILVVFCACTLPANSVVPEISNVSIKVTPITTIPEVNYSRNLPLKVYKSHVTNHWQAIVVEYTPKAKRKSKGTGYQNENLARARQYLDNVEVNVRVICETDGPNATEQYALFTGNCRLWFIKLDGLRHTVIFFVPPWLLDRYFFPHAKLRGIRAANAKLRPEQVKSGLAVHRVAKNDLSIEVTFNVNNSVVASGYLNVVNSKKSPAKVSFGRKVEKVVGGYVFEGAVMSLRQSPWAYSDINLFDPEKPATAK